MNHVRRLPHSLVLCAVACQLLAAAACAAWSTDPAVNTPICTATGDQLYTAAISDGAGGAIITWHDRRLGLSNTNIYAQRVDATGAVLWAADGVVVCDAVGNQDYPILASDGTGGAFVVWSDLRSGPAQFAQHINAAGTPLWTANGIAFVTGSGGNKWVTPDGTGGIICAWEDARGGVHGDIWAQRMAGNGTVYWPINGVAVCSAPYYQTYIDMTSDGAGGAIITWQDSRETISTYGIYAQRINAAGSAVWTANGIVVCNLDLRQTRPKIVSDQDGGAIICWQDRRIGGTDDSIFAQRVNSAGSPLWAANGVDVCTYAGYQTGPLCVSDGAGGAVFCWRDTRLNVNYFMQRLDSAGARKWDPDGVPITSTSTAKLNYSMESDGNGGAFVAWQDLRGANSYDIYAQNVDSLGTAAWTANGVAMGTAALAQRFPAVVSAGAGGAIVAFEDVRSSTDSDIYAQKVSADGSLGNGTATGVRDGDLPAAARLLQNHPNPFNPTTTIRFVMPQSERARLALYDLRGRLVRVLVDDEKVAGNHEVQWDGTNNRGQLMASGVYVCRMEAVSFRETRRMTLMK